MAKFIFCTFYFWSNLVFSNVLSIQLPGELIKDDKPIPPKCFYNLIVNDTKNMVIDLTSSPCMHYSDKLDQHMLKKNWLGYELDDEQPVMRMPYIYYKFIAQQPDSKYIILLNWGGGGTGSFTNLITVQLKQDKLSITKYIAGGDRCFGGIENVSYNNQLSYQVQTTPEMLVDPFNKLSLKQKSIEYCAVCCVGKMNIVNGKDKSFQFNGYIPSVSQGNYQQQCFNNLISSFGAKHKSNISSSQVNQLRSEFNRICVS